MKYGSVVSTLNQKGMTNNDQKGTAIVTSYTGATKYT